MKKKYLAIGLLCALCFKAKGQNKDSLYQKKLISKTDIELVYAQYLQDGNNSAVTGGKGTEKLTVYSPSVKISHTFRDFNTLRFNGGVDAVTSASTDKIDFVVSSASKKDYRTYATLVYERKLKRKEVVIGAGSGFSIESDYFSVPILLSAEYTTPSKLTTYTIGLQAYFDDLRWGRINPDYWRPVKLIYPVELRDTVWFDNYRRTSYNLKFGLTQVINRRLVAGIFPEITYQKGLLSTPFHRVYFKDSTLKVEKLPAQRYKIPISLKLNYFLGSRTILRFNYGFYRDNFGIRANSIELEAAIKAASQWTFTPFLRIYHQSASRYFNGYREHLLTQEFYTSDYDLSGFTSYKTGMNFRYLPAKLLTKKISFDELNLRYSYFYRSNGLNAHMITLAARFYKEKFKRVE